MNKIQQKRESNGRLFENLILDKLKENKYWAIKLQTGFSGTPFDILAIKDSKVLALECKHFKNMPKRINKKILRDNQLTGLNYFTKVAKGKSLIVFGNIYEIRIVEFNRLMEKGSVEVKECERFTNV